MSAEATAILDAFFDRLKANDMVIVHRSVLVAPEQDLAALQRNTLRKEALTSKQISDAKLWGDISPAMVRQLIKKHCRTGETIELNSSKNRKLTKVIRAGVERVARIRNIVWLD